MKTKSLSSFYFRDELTKFAKEKICVNPNIDKWLWLVVGSSVVIFFGYVGLVEFFVQAETTFETSFIDLKMFASTAFFTMLIFCITFWGFSTNNLQSSATVLCVAVTGISGCHYLLESLQAAPYTKSVFGRNISLIEYGEWITTVPLLVCVLGLILQLQTDAIFWAAGLQVVFLACGLIGCVITDKVIAGCFLLLGLLLFVPFLMFVYIYCFELAHLLSLSQVQKIHFLGHSILYLWGAYPVITFTGMCGLISSDAERIIFILLDVCSKSWFVALALAYQFQAEVGNLSKKLAQVNEATSTQRIFLRFVFHEVRIPFHSVTTGLNQMSSVENMGAYRPLIQAMVQSAESMEHTINDVLTLSKLEEGKLSTVCTPVSLEEIFQSTISSLKALIEEKGLTVLLNSSLGMPVVLGDADYLTQIAANLLSNAIEFSEEKSTIKIKIYVKDQTQHKCSIGIKVRHNGIKLSKEEQDQIFQPFVHIRPQENQQERGTGLGLRITKGLVELMDGEINLTSGSDNGTEFCVSLVLGISPDKPSTSEVQMTLEAMQIRKRLQLQEHDTLMSNYAIETPHDKHAPLALIVDDVATNRKFTGMILVKQGFRVEEAENGEEAITMAQEKEYDIIFMDNTMPVKNGIEATKEITKFSKTPIVGLTGNSLEDDITDFISAGAVEVLVKPCKRDKIINALDLYASRQGQKQISKEKQM